MDIWTVSFLVWLGLLIITGAKILTEYLMVGSFIFSTPRQREDIKKIGATGVFIICLLFWWNIGVLIFLKEIMKGDKK